MCNGLDLAWRVDVLEFVGQAVEVADDLGEHAAADAVIELVGGDFEKAAGGSAGIRIPIAMKAMTAT